MAVRMMYCGISGSGTLILDDVKDPWLHTVVVGSIVYVVQKLGDIVLRTYNHRALGLSVLAYHSDSRTQLT